MERELKKVGITIQTIWEKYIETHPDGLRVTQFRNRFKDWSNKVNPVMHMNHKAGDWDKSLVEGAVKILYRRIYANLKDSKYFSIEDLNQEIWNLLDAHNNKKLTGRPYSRFELFMEDERHEL